MEAMGSVTLRRRLAVAPAGGPGASARVADPRSCPILSSRSCSRRSRSMSSGFRAAPWARKRDTHTASDTLTEQLYPSAPQNSSTSFYATWSPFSSCSRGLNTNDRQFLTSLPYLHATNQPVLLPSFPHTHTHKFKHVPVKDVVVGEALAVEEVAEELPQVGVVGFVIKPQRAAEVEVC